MIRPPDLSTLMRSERLRGWLDAEGQLVWTDKDEAACERPRFMTPIARVFVRCYECRGELEIVRFRAMPHVCRGGVVA